MLEELLKKKLIEINTVIDENSEKIEKVGLFSGLAGITLFRFYYSFYTGKDEDAEKGIDSLRDCIHSLNKANVSPTYCDGMVGVAWAFDHLKKEDFSDTGAEEIFVALEDFFNHNLIHNLNANNYDFLHGGIGYVFYFLSRYEKTENPELKQKYFSILNNAIVLLKEKAEIDEENRMVWLNIIKNEKKVHDIGLSHGTSSIIAVLTRMVKHDVFKDAVFPLLTGAIKYVRHFEQKEEGRVSIFPTTILNGEIEKKRSRLAWCYGDLGIGVTLFNAGRTLGDIELETFALEVLESSLKRQSPKSTGVVDAMICHGSFGNAQLYSYLYKITKKEQFKKATEFWLNEGLNRAINKDGFAGFKTWRGEDEDGANELSLLEGITGIGLVIIDYLKEEDLNWDECLLLS